MVAARDDTAVFVLVVVVVVVVVVEGVTESLGLSMILASIPPLKINVPNPFLVKVTLPVVKLRIVCRKRNVSAAVFAVIVVFPANLAIAVSVALPVPSNAP